MPRLYLVVDVYIGRPTAVHTNQNRLGALSLACTAVLVRTTALGTTSTLFLFNST